MNFETHCISYSYKEIPYRKDNNPAYAWVLKEPFSLSEPFSIQWINSLSCIEVSNLILKDITLAPICLSPGEYLVNS
jgi:hypothetical protein